MGRAPLNETGGCLSIGPLEVAAATMFMCASEKPRGSVAKRYQEKQVRAAIVRYKLPAGTE